MTDIHRRLGKTPSREPRGETGRGGVSDTIKRILGGGAVTGGIEQVVSWR